jgi:hypothetical protein
VWQNIDWTKTGALNVAPASCLFVLTCLFLFNEEATMINPAHCNCDVLIVILSATASVAEG